MTDLKCPHCGKVDWHTKDANGNYNCGCCLKTFKKGAPMGNTKVYHSD